MEQAEILAEMRRLATEVSRLSQENEVLRQQQQSQSQQAQQTPTTTAPGDERVQAQMIGALSRMTEVLEEMKKDRGGAKKELMDSKGLGKPSTFPNKEDQYLKWMRSLENYAAGVFGEEFRSFLEWAASAEAAISKGEVLEQFGPDSDDVDRIDEIVYKNGQLYLCFAALTEGETNDLVVGAGPGNGAEAWRKVNKRWDPAIAGRKNALLKQIIHPPRCKMEDLVGCWERWEEQVRRYERRKTEGGERLKIQDETLMAAFESLVPEDLENHLVLNRKRIKNYQAQKEEIQEILDSRIGGQVKEFSVRGEGGNDHRAGRSQDADVNSFGDPKGWKKGPGKDKGKGRGACFTCGSPEHYSRDCVYGYGHKGKRDGGKGGKGKETRKGHGNSGDKGGTPKGKGKGKWSFNPKGFPGWKGRGKGKGKSKEKGMASFGDDWTAQDGGWHEGDWEQDSWQDHGGNAGWSGDWQAGQEAQGQQEATSDFASFSLDVSAFEKHQSHPSVLGSFGDEEEAWLKINYDTGAAVTGIPEQYAIPGAKGNGDKFTTASGELVEDQGGLRIQAVDENGRMARISGRIAKVHKILCSASRCAQAGKNGWVTDGGGYLIPDDSALSHKIKKLIDVEAAKPYNQLIPVYQENGVYNFYVKMGKGIKGTKVEVLNDEVSRVAPRGENLLAAVKRLSKEELEEEVVASRRRLGSPGFPRQPSA